MTPINEHVLDALLYLSDIVRDLHDDGKTSETRLRHLGHVVDSLRRQFEESKEKEALSQIGEG